MRSTDFLFQLIKSLSKGERRNFKLFAQLQDGDKQYIRLFEAIDEQDEYNEKLLLEHFKDEKFIRQFSVAKNYLHNFILRTLHIFEKDSAGDLPYLMHQILILKAKNLFDQAHKLLRKARLIAERNERFQELIQLLQTERELFFLMTKHQDFDVLFADLEKHELLAMDRSRNLIQYHHLIDQVMVLLKKSHSARKNTDLEIFQHILTNPFIANPEMALSTRAKIQRLTILIDCYQFAGKYPECETYSKELIELYESTPEILKDRKLRYLEALSYLSVFQNWNHKENETLDTLKKLKNYPSETDEERIMIFEKYYSYIIGYSITKSDPELGLEGIAEIEANEKFVENKLRKSVRLVIYYLSGYYFLYNNQPSKALKWVNMILNEPKSELRVDLQCMTRIMNLIIHYELGNKDLIEYFIKSTTRFLSKKDRLLKFEKAIMHFLNQYLHQNSQEETRNSLIQLRDEMKNILSDPFERKASELFDVMKWIDSRLAGKPMTEFEKVKIG